MRLVSTNPSRNYEVIGEVEMSTPEDVQVAVARSRQAQAGWAALSLEERGRAVASLANAIEAETEALAELLAKETGFPLAEARDDVSSGVSFMKAHIANAVDYLKPEITHETEAVIHEQTREPRGVIAAICPWNFPTSNIAWQCAPALLAGNTIVYKNSEENPLFAQKIAALVAQSELPASVFTVLYGDGSVGEMLVRSAVDMISFTGSLPVGKKLTVIGAEKFIPVVTELGGSSPLVVFEDVELDEATVGFIYARRFSHSGQYCSSSKRLIVHEDKFDELVAKLRALVTSKKVGDALDSTTDLGPLVAERQVVRLAEQVDKSVAQGAKVVCGGRRPAGLQGAYYEPTILTDVTFDMPVWREETFGPVLPIVPFKTEAEAVQLANDTIYGLGAHVLTNDNDRFARVARQLESGMVAQGCNGYFHPNNPFGGYKQSGMGRENGAAGFHDVTQIKLITRTK